MTYEEEIRGLKDGMGGQQQGRSETFAETVKDQFGYGGADEPCTSVSSCVIRGFHILMLFFSCRQRSFLDVTFASEVCRTVPVRCISYCSMAAQAALVCAYHTRRCMKTN
jgi:hypothetical protein